MDKADVWMPLFIGDYLADTGRLTTEQHGAYLLLIMDYWRNGPPPDDEATLAQITRLSPDAWGIAQAKLKQFFSIEDGIWRHKRVDGELVLARTNKEKAQAKARLAAAARWGKHSDDATGNATSNATGIPQAMHKECPSPSPSSIKSNSKSLSAQGANEEKGEKKTVQVREKPQGTPGDLKCARALFDLVLANNPRAKSPSFEAWANDIRLLRERDDHTREEAFELFSWAQDDSFWRANILSPAKLRAQWDQLVLRRAGVAEKKAANWMSCEKAATDKAAELGIDGARPGESMQIFRDRIATKLDAMDRGTPPAAKASLTVVAPDQPHKSIKPEGLDLKAMITSPKAAA